MKDVRYREVSLKLCRIRFRGRLLSINIVGLYYQKRVMLLASSSNLTPPPPPHQHKVVKFNTKFSAVKRGQSFEILKL